MRTFAAAFGTVFLSLLGEVDTQIFDETQYWRFGPLVLGIYMYFNVFIALTVYIAVVDKAHNSALDVHEYRMSLDERPERLLRRTPRHTSDGVVHEGRHSACGRTRAARPGGLTGSHALLCRRMRTAPVVGHDRLCRPVTTPSNPTATPVPLA